MALSLLDSPEPVRFNPDCSSGLPLQSYPHAGKTMWLSYMLVCLLIKHEAVAYHGSDGTFLFFPYILVFLSLQTPIFLKPRHLHAV